MINDSDSSDDDHFFHFRKMRKQSENAKQERNKGGGSKVGKASNLNRFRTDYENHDNVHTFLDFKNIRMNYMSEGEHFQLRNNLIEHLWIQYENK